MTSAGPEMRVARRDALPLTGPDSFDPLLDRIGDASCVLLGAASHGTAAYERWRSALTRRLVDEKAFSLVAVADGTHGPQPGLMGRTPGTPFRTTDRPPHDARPGRGHAAVLGLDRYGHHEALRTVLDWLCRHDPDHLDTALGVRARMERCGGTTAEYAQAPRLVPAEHEEEVVRLLTARVRERRTAGHPGRRHRDGKRDSGRGGDLGPGAEAYYRALVGGGTAAWNAYDIQLADALDTLRERSGPGTKAVVWGHVARTGDVCGTGLAPAGLVSLGGLVRERHGAGDCVLVGCGSYEGTVLAADHWAGRPQVLELPPARAGGLEDRLHTVLDQDAALFLVPAEQYRPGWLREPVPHRAVGTVYRPERDVAEVCLPTVVGQRYDAFLYFARTGARPPEPEQVPAPPDAL